MAQQKASADPAVEDIDPQTEQAADIETAEQETGEVTDSAEIPESLSELDDLKLQLQQANDKAEQNWESVLRTRAEMENLRKRQTRELENAHKYALDKIAMELLPVRDTLEMGVTAAHADEAEMTKIVEGTELTLKMLTQTLEKFNIVEVSPEGEKFNPDLHQAISMQEGTDEAANTVLVVMQKGYTLNERLLRPAMVVIAK
ncbi:nucleotide exchange factor GrpE [Chromatiales bacterium (ex Bugula neritina AB1)]|nr:nucleotide exchange factor GrpE [Chromatiales bacterium (ex Bugula neritina AB1)]